jgi:hypothetical protein
MLPVRDMTPGIVIDPGRPSDLTLAPPYRRWPNITTASGKSTNLAINHRIWTNSQRLLIWPAL